MCPLNHETYRNSDAKRTHAYDANGNMLQEKENNVVQNAYTYDELNQLLTATDKNGATTTYTYDANNNISSKTIAHASSDIYTADYAGTSETYSNITSHTQTMEYDSGNRMTNRYETITGMSNGSAKTATYRTMYSYTGGGGLSFKREITDATYRDKTYQYNARNQLIAYREHYVLKASYTYDTEGYRSSKTVDGTTTKFYWDRGYTSNESDGTNFTAKNTIGINGIIARKTGSQTPVYLMKDVHGDTTALLRSNSQVGTYDYDEYGNITDSTGTIDNPYRYCGEYVDNETGFIYLRNRYYDPATSRMLSEDPARQGANWYIYCNNNPLKYIDPSGLYYLEKDSNGQVYAVIEPGDTLSGISYSEVRDSTAYTKLNYADPGYLEVGQRVNITGIYNKSYPVPTNIMLSKTSHTQGDSGLRDVPDDEISRRARDKSLPGEERRRYQREEKLRGQRNKQKRQSHYSIDQSKLPYPNTEFSPAPSQSYPTVNMPDSQFWSNVGAGVITVVGVVAGIYYFCYTGDPSMIYQYAH